MNSLSLLLSRIEIVISNGLVPSIDEIHLRELVYNVGLLHAATVALGYLQSS
jgi:hypothetical protein